MHILTLVLAGFALLAIFAVAARRTNRSLRAILPVYLVIWGTVSVVNGWIGVRQAGYTVMEEVLVFLPVFGLPALAAIALARHLR